MGVYNPPKEHRVWFGGTRINTPDWASTGVGVSIDAIEGWEGSVEVEDNREPRPGAAGELVNTSRMRGRDIIVSGMVNGSSWEDVQSRKRTLAGVFVPSSDEVLLKVPKPDAVAGATYADYCVSTLGAVAHWRLGGATAAAAGDNYEGTAAYDITFSGSPTYGATGALAESDDTAVDFDGSSDYGVVSYAAALAPAAFTVSAWIKLGATGANQSVVHCTNGAANGFDIRVTAGNVIRITTSSGSAVSLDGGTTLSAGTWYHVVAGNDGTNSFIYLDGESDVAAAAKGYTANSGVNIGIAGSHTGSTLFDGTIDDVTLWNRALTAAEITQLYTLGSTGYTTSDMTNYERVSARVVEPIRFEDLDGPQRQAFVVALRASDPRVYDDVETSVSDSGTSPSVTTTNAGTVASPATVTVTGPIDGPFQIENTTTGKKVRALNTYDLGATYTATASTSERTFIGGQTYEDAMLSLNPVGYWRCDNASGNLTDSSGNGYDFSAGADASITYSQTTVLDEADGSAVLVEGDPLNADLGFKRSTGTTNPMADVSSFTMMAWVKTSNATGDVCLPFEFGNASLQASSTGVTPNGFLVKGPGMVQGRYLPSGTYAQQWVFLAATHVAGNTVLYLNGEEIYAEACSITKISSTTTFRIAVGKADTGSATDGGVFDEIAFFGYALDASDISALYDIATQSSAVTGPIYRHLDAANTSWPDVAPGSNTFTLESDDATPATTSGTTLQVAYRPARI